MKKFCLPAISFLLMFPLFSCKNRKPGEPSAAKNAAVALGTYLYDANFLKSKDTGTIELISSNGSARVLASPKYQGRVMTSTASGDSGLSFGWINYDLISSGEVKQQFNPVGGEERIWLGPEGGQYSIYFKKGDSFDIAHWQVPGFIDTAAYTVQEKDQSHALFLKEASFSNYSGTAFNVRIERSVTLLSRQDMEARLLTKIPDSLQFVGFETINRVRNSGNADWQKDKGLLSIWLLGMFTPSDETTVIIPFKPINEARSFITDDYFGTIPPGRLRVRDSVLLFTCDGKYRSKIGLSPAIAKPMAASFDFKHNVLTLVMCQVEEGRDYVNSKWELQKEPYKGDVVNSYNDGPLADGTQLGPFYEIESSSPALELRRGAVGEYRQTTCHFEGSYTILRQLAMNLLGIDLDSIKK